MKIVFRNRTTIISSIAFIIGGIILIDINRALSYVLFGVGILIEALGVIDEIRETKNNFI